MIQRNETLKLLFVVFFHNEKKQPQTHNILKAVAGSVE